MIAALNIWNIVAAYFWYLFLRRKLRYVVDKQSIGTLVAFFMAGVASVVLTFVLHTLYPLPWLVQSVYESEFLYGVLVTGMVEETAKFTCFFMIAHYLMTVKEPQDGVLQGAAVGLGFATVENILYFNWYPELFIAIRPILNSGGHMLLGAVWGGMYSAAAWSNAHSDDPGAYRVAIFGVLIMAFAHGVYNSILVFGLLLGILVDGAILLIAVPLFTYLQRKSPYRRYPLEQANVAVSALERGLVFNRKSPILNRRLGIYLMRLKEYKRAAEHLIRAMPRTRNRRTTRFFAAICESTFLPTHHAEKGLRVTWGRLTDSERERVMQQAETILSRDSELFQYVKDFLASAFARRRGKHGYELAREIKLRKHTRNQTNSRRIEEHVAKLSQQEREALRRKMRHTTKPVSGSKTESPRRGRQEEL